MAQTGVTKASGFQIAPEGGADNVSGRGNRLMAGLAAAGLGLAGALLGGFPIWAARRIIYPMGAEPLPQSLDLGLDVGSSVVAERVEFQSMMGDTLEGWFVPGPDPSQAPWPTVLLVYGYGGYKEQMVGYAQMLHGGGFATFMFDMQGSGRLRGRPITLGFNERWDVVSAVRYLAGRPDVDRGRIGGLGVSMGAASLLLAGAEAPAIRAIVSDSSYADVEMLIRPGLSAFVGPLAIPYAPLIVRIAENMIGAKAADIVPEKAVAESGQRPLFIIHGADDTLVLPESAGRLEVAARGPVDLWIVPGCPHSQAPAIYPEEYRDRVNGFFSRWLAGSPPHSSVETAAGTESPRH